MLTIQMTLDTSDGNSVDVIEVGHISLPSPHAGYDTFDRATFDKIVERASERLVGAVLIAGVKERA